MGERGAGRDPEHVRRVLSLFEQARELQAGERETLLSTPTEDAEVTDAVRAMLRAEHDRGGELVASMIAGAATESASRDEVTLPQGHRIGGFTIRGVIGSGGMGTVYEALQDEPPRRVALKVLRADIEGTAAERRFRREILALSHLDHPGVARIHDAGVLVERGRTLRWFAMELVDGSRIDQWARECRAGTKAVLDAMVAVSHIVHAAHQRGIIHRDLKPANILVGRDRKVTIIDFGVAAAVSRDVIGTVGVTLDGVFLGTLRYTAPEQLGGDARPDVRADVYALGMVLHELLTGRPAIPVDGVPFLEAIRVLRDESPTRLGSLRREWRGDIEAIVAKATDKDPRGRYQSANEMANDLESHLDGRPVVASKAGPWSRMIAYARRHRLVVGACSLSLAALIVGGAFTVRGWLQSHASAERVGYLMEWVSHALLDREATEGRIAQLEELVAKLDAETPPDDPNRFALVKSDVLQRIGEISVDEGQYERARGPQQAALALRDAVLQERRNDPDVLGRLSISLVKVGDLEKERWRLAEAKSWYDRALAIDEGLAATYTSMRSYADQLCWSYERCGWIAWESGELKRAQELWRRRHDLALALVQRFPQSTHSWHNLYCSHAFQVTVASALGDEAAVSRHLAGGLEAAEKLLDKRPHDPELRAIRDSARTQCAAKSADRSCSPEEEKAGLDALNDAEDWLHAGPADPRRLRLAATWYEWRARHLCSGSDSEDARRAESRRWLDRAGETLKDLIARAPQLREPRQALAAFYLGRAGDEHAEGNVVAAALWLDQCMDLCRELLKESHDGFTVHILVQALLDPRWGKARDPATALALLDEHAASGGAPSLQFLTDLTEVSRVLGDSTREAAAIRRILDALPDGPSARRSGLERRLSELAPR